MYIQPISNILYIHISSIHLIADEPRESRRRPIDGKPSIEETKIIVFRAAREGEYSNSEENAVLDEEGRDHTDPLGDQCAVTVSGY